MGALVLQRLAFGALVLLSIVFLSHLGLAMARGTPFHPALSQAASKTLAYLGRLAHGDLGLSAAGSITLRPIPVAEVVPAALLRSLGLLAAALLIATAVGTMLGTWAALRRHSRWSLGILLASIVGVSVPSFFAALLLQLAVLRWAQLFGHAPVPVGGFGWDRHLILPALAFFIAILGFNLFGEGVRSMVESVGVGITRLVNRYTLALAVLAVLGIGWVRDNTGAVAFYRRQPATGGSTRLANLFGASARRMGVRMRRVREPVDLSIVFEEKSPAESGQEAPSVRLSWEGWEATSRTAADTLETVSAERLAQAGRTLALALMVLGRETGY